MEIKDIVPEPDWNEYVIQDEPTPPTPKNIVSAFFLNGMANAVKGLITQISDILYDLGLIKDYVIEIGSNSNGNWEKWHSGKLVQWGKTSITGVNTSWYDSGYGWFYSPEVSWDYPVSFIGIPHMIATFDDERVANRGSLVGKSRAESTYALFRASALRVDVGDNDYPIIITIFLIGRWK